jgi:hypothetical protein
MIVRFANEEVEGCDLQRTANVCRPLLSPEFKKVALACVEDIGGRAVPTRIRALESSALTFPSPIVV